MLQVCLALVPGIAAYVWLIGPAILVQLLIATLAALLAEACMLRIQGKPLTMFLSDGSAVVTAWLIALAFPPLAPGGWCYWHPVRDCRCQTPLRGPRAESIQPGHGRLCRLHRCLSITDVTVAKRWLAHAAD
jgi:hypothetical protein